MTIHIKNMVCDRCKLAVRQIFETAGLPAVHVDLGTVSIEPTSITQDQYDTIDKMLQALGFERIDDRRARVIENIKNAVIRKIHYGDISSKKLNWSTILSDEIHYEYNYLSNLFSSVEGITLEQYIIRQKIERAKELLLYDELTLSEIALRLGYSSVAHLSSQFKKVTGFTPSALKRQRWPEKSRTSLDKIPAKTPN